jgi:hypothetical protein
VSRRPCHPDYPTLVDMSNSRQEVRPHPPATKCAHDFPDLTSWFATGVPSGCLGGVTSPSSRDEGGSDCNGCVAWSRMLRGSEACCSVIEGRWRGVWRIWILVLDGPEWEGRTQSGCLSWKAIRVYEHHASFCLLVMRCGWNCTCSLYLDFWYGRPMRLAAVGVKSSPLDCVVRASLKRK